MKRVVFIFLALSPIAVPFSHGQSIRAVFANPPGSPDDGYEYVELTGPANTGIANLWFLVIDGDGMNAGTIDVAKDLTDRPFGANGLLLLRDGPAVLLPAPSPQTSVQNILDPGSLENGSTTYLLVTNFTGSVGDDIDSNDDGTPNAAVPWTMVKAAIGMVEYDENMNMSINISYASAFGGVQLDPIVDYNPDFLYYNGTVLSGAEVDGTNPGPYTVSTTEATNPADFGRGLTPGATAGPLPVVLKYFQAKQMKAGRGVELRWITGSEQNNAAFFIERSAEGRVFGEIGKLPGAGNAQNEKHYTFTDAQPLPGLNYYRLRQVDYDGNAAYSPVRPVMIGREAGVRVSPSPADERALIQLDETVAENGTWQLFDPGGKLVRTGLWQAEKDQLELDVTALPRGIYTFRLVAGRRVQTKQFSKQ